jgi:hypothetical protein
VTYTLTATLDPAGVDATAGPITIHDEVPDGFSPNNPDGTDWSCFVFGSLSGDGINCTYTGSFPIAAGAPIGGPITFHAFAPSAVTAPLTATNTATLAILGDETDATASADVTVLPRVVRNNPATSVPTLSQWALLALIALLGVFSAAGIRDQVAGTKRQKR